MEHAAAKLSEQKFKWADCQKQADAEKLSGRESWSILCSWMTSRFWPKGLRIDRKTSAIDELTGGDVCCWHISDAGDVELESAIAPQRTSTDR